MKSGSAEANSYHSGRTPALDQIIGVGVEAINDVRINAKMHALAAQDKAFNLAVEQLDDVHNFLSKPKNILGNETTKHGEIAEHVEVGIRNAREAISQKTMNATFNNVPRTGPVDFFINGNAVQSKFINGTIANLNHVLDHLDAYQDFTENGSYYMIPRDHYDAIQTIREGGHIEGFKAATEEKIRELVKQIEDTSGKSYEDVVESSVVEYKDVQINTVSDTLDKEKGQLSFENENKKDIIEDDHKPALSEAAYSALFGAAMGASVSITIELYSKYKEGKNIFKGDFTSSDFRDVGLTAGKGACGGAIAASSIYLFTNYAGMSAPFAAAVVSASKSIYSLQASYRNGDITFDEFIDLGMITCAESAIVGVSTVVGQGLIPVPVLGAVIGSVAGKMLAQFSGKESKRVTQRLQEDMEKFKTHLDEQMKQVLARITAEFDHLNDLTEAAFDFRLNTSLLVRSVDLAEAYGVKADKIIMDEPALDNFMLE